MLLSVILTLSVGIIIFTSILHYKQHFKLYSPSSISRQPSIKRRTAIFVTRQQSVEYRRYECCCWISAIEGQKYDFFPSSFSYFTLFLIFLCTILTTKYSVGTSHMFVYQKTIANICDLVLIYGIMILSVCESMFSFCRYFTTKIATQHCRIVTTQYCLKYFLIYVILYCAVWIVQTHFIHSIFPVVVVVHCTFNLYCISANAKMLIKQYKPLQQTIAVNNDILNAVYFMRRVSIVSSIISTLYLSVFLYTLKSTYYLPISWAISCFIFSLNFVKNRKYIQYKIFQVSQYVCCHCNKYTNDIKNMNSANNIPNIILKSSTAQTSPKTLKISVEATEETQETQVQQTGSYDKVHLETPSIEPSQAHLYNNAFKSVAKRVRMKSTATPSVKALEMLGISPAVSNRYHCDAYKIKKSDLILDTKNSKSNSSKSKTKSNISTLSLKLGIKTKSESNYVSMDNENSEDSDSLALDSCDEKSNGQSNKKIALKNALSLPFRAIKKTHLTVTRSAKPKLKESASVPSPKEKSEGFNFNNNEATDDIGMIYVGQYSDNNNVQNGSEMTESKNPKRRNGIVKKKRRAPINRSLNFLQTDMDEQNLKQIFVSFNLLAAHGFCSQKSINSAHDLQLHKIHLTQSFADLKLDEIDEIEEEEEDANDINIKLDVNASSI